MNLQEALDLAIEIEADPGYLVIAIGRFQLVENLLRSHEPFPWCITIIARNAERPSPTKIGDRDAWNTVRNMAAQINPPAQPTKPATKRRDEQHTRQPTLF